MRTFSATDAAFAGFKVMRARPWLVPVWALLMYGSWFVIGILLVVIMGASMLASDISAIGSDPSPEQMLKVMGAFAPALAILIPLGLLFAGIVMAAVNRAVIRPQEKGFFYLRIGMDEVRQVVVAIVQFFGWAAYAMVCAIVLGASGVIAGQAGGAAGFGFGFIASLAMIAGALFLGVKFSLAGAQTFQTKQINIFGAWELSKGRFWPMLGAYLLAFVFYLVLYAVLFALQLLGPNAATMGQDMSSISGMIVWFIVILAVTGVVSVMMNLVLQAPAPSIYKAIATDPVEQAETFA